MASTANQDAFKSAQIELQDGKVAQDAIDKCKEMLEYKSPPDPILKYALTAGHKQKVYDVSFSADSKHIVTGSQDGFCKVIDTTTNLQVCKPIKVTFIKSVALSPSGKLVASCGMDNKITLTDISSAMDPVTKKEMPNDEGYIACLDYLNATTLVSASCDGKAGTWDVSTGQLKQAFEGHQGDCSSLGLAADNQNMFATGSGDNTCRLWDIRTGKCARLFQANAEVNCVSIHPNGGVLVTGNDNGNHQLFDCGSNSCIDTGKPKNKKVRILANCMSRSGRYTYSGMTTGQIMCCDTFCVNKWKMVSAHSKYLCAMSVSADGSAMVTSSFDTDEPNVKLWIGGDGTK